MKKIIYLLALVFQFALAQEKTSLDTIFANDIHNVSMFFPNPVRQGIVGAANFTFSYNEDTPQHFGLLKAIPGKESSLLVLTTDGRIYSYFLKYRAELPGLNYFIKECESIGNELPQVKDQDSHKEETALDTKVALRDSIARASYFENLSSYYLRNTTSKLKSKKKDRIMLTVKELIYYRNEIFMVFELQNQSGIDFEINYLNVYLIRGNKKRNASFQKILKEPIYTHGVPVTVKDQQRKKFVYVLPKYTVGENERIEVEVREKNGNRFLKMGFRKD